MGSPQGSDREANRRSDQGRGFNRGSGRGSNRESRTGQRSNTRTHYSSRGQYIRYCEICKVNGHNNLLFCPKLPEYVPGVSSLTGTKSIPKEICKYCLSTAGHFSTCLHTFPRNYNDWICKQSKISIVLCNCKDNDYLEWKHQGPQEWLRRNFNPNIGLSNLYNAWIRFRHSKNNSVLINTVQVEENIPDIKTNNVGNIVSNQTPMNVEVMLVNDLPIGRAYSPFEILRIQTKTGCHPVVLIYDTGAQVSLCNPETNTLLIETKQTNKKLTISTIDGVNSEQREIHTLDLGNGQQMDA